MSVRYTWRLRLECGHSIIWGPHDNEGNRREVGQIAACEICPNPALAERKIVEVNNVKTMLTLNSPTTGEVIRLDKGDAVTLIDRLNAALDEDERIARATMLSPNDNGEWAAVTDHDGDGRFGVLGTCISIGMVGRNGDLDDPAQAEHIVRHDPSRVLRQVEGARKLLAPHRGVHRCDWGEHRGGEFEPCGTVLALAEMFGVEP